MPSQSASGRNLPEYGEQIGEAAGCSCMPPGHYVGPSHDSRWCPQPLPGNVRWIPNACRGERTVSGELNADIIMLAMPCFFCQKARNCFARFVPVVCNVVSALTTLNGWELGR